MTCQFKLILGGEREILGIGINCLNCFGQTPKLFKNLKCVFAAQVLNACCCYASKTDTLLTPSWAGYGDEGGVGFWGAPFS